MAAPKYNPSTNRGKGLAPKKPPAKVIPKPRPTATQALAAADRAIQAAGAYKTPEQRKAALDKATKTKRAIQAAGAYKTPEQRKAALDKAIAVPGKSRPAASPKKGRSRTR